MDPSRAPPRRPPPHAPSRRRRFLSSPLPVAPPVLLYLSFFSPRGEHEYFRRRAAGFAWRTQPLWALAALVGFLLCARYTFVLTAGTLPWLLAALLPRRVARWLWPLVAIERVLVTVALVLLVLFTNIEVKGGIHKQERGVAVAAARRARCHEEGGPPFTPPFTPPRSRDSRLDHGACRARARWSSFATPARRQTVAVSRAAASLDTTNRPPDTTERTVGTGPLLAA